MNINIFIVIKRQRQYLKCILLDEKEMQLSY